jgi:hypothetical protein
VKKLLKKKPARKKPAPAPKPDLRIELDVIEFKVDRLTKNVQLTHEMVRDMIAAPRHGAFHDFKMVVDQMGRSLSEQVHLLARELPPNKHDALMRKLDELERRVNLLEREATYTVRHVITKPMEENHDTDSGTETQSG